MNGDNLYAADNPTATPEQKRSAIKRGYLLYFAALALLVGAAIAVGIGLDNGLALTALIVGLSATFGWAGVMHHVHAIAWDASPKEDLSEE